MYCEKKGAECGYLGVMNEVREALTIDRAFETDAIKESVMGHMGNRIETAIDKGKSLECSDSFCSVVAYAIVKSMEVEAEIKTQEEGREQ